MNKIIVLVTTASLLLSACSQKENGAKTNQSKNSNEESSMNHLHGMGFIGDQGNLYMANHDGLKRYEEGEGITDTSAKHDFMGFQAVDSGFYSSGHPGEGSDLKNPLGLIKSEDEGKNLKKLAFYGEIDFHFLAVGYKSHVTYAVNQQENTELDQGLLYSKDEGQSWNQSHLKGLPQASVGMIAAHPTKADVMGVVTAEGIYLSSTNGDEFSPFSDKLNTTSMAFGEDYILYSYLKDNKVAIMKQNLNGEDGEKVKAPTLSGEKNAVMYLAINPNNENEIAIATESNDIYITKDNGENWERLTDNG